MTGKKENAKSVILTATGRDRVGIVAEVADLLFKSGCNLLDSSMTLLRGEFAIILMVELSENRSVESLIDCLAESEKKTGLKFNARLLNEDELKEEEQEGTPYLISVYGADRPGIVAGITAKLAALGCNITDCQTKMTPGENTHVYVMILEAFMPEHVSSDKIDNELKESAGKLGCDITIQQLEVYEL